MDTDAYANRDADTNTTADGNVYADAGAACLAQRRRDRSSGARHGHPDWSRAARKPGSSIGQ
jgi:hypothetical protein